MKHPRTFVDLVLNDEDCAAWSRRLAAIQHEYDEILSIIGADAREARAAGDDVRACELEIFLRRY